LLGWLFKRDAVIDSSEELLIFITPRIVKLEERPL
jgi:type II secretory pathway component HofQ